MNALPGRVHAAGVVPFVENLPLLLLGKYLEATDGRGGIFFQGVRQRFQRTMHRLAHTLRPNRRLDLRSERESLAEVGHRQHQRVVGSSLSVDLPYTFPRFVAFG